MTNIMIKEMYHYSRLRNGRTNDILCGLGRIAREESNVDFGCVEPLWISLFTCAHAVTAYNLWLIAYIQYTISPLSMSYLAPTILSPSMSLSMGLAATVPIIV